MLDNLNTKQKIEYRCYRCRMVDTKPLHFFRSHSDYYSNHGYMPICKNCLNELYNRYLLAFHDVPKAIKRLCMAFNIYYNEELVKRCMEAKSTSVPTFGDYIKKLNLPHYKKKTFDSSIEEGCLYGFFEDNTVKSNEVEERITTIPKSVRARWGAGFTDDEYKTLEEHYRYLKDANQNFDSNQEIFIMDLCQIKMQQINAMKSGRTDDYIKLTESYRKTFSQAGLRTVRDSTNEDEFSFGLTAQMIEQYTPAEYYKNKERYKDFDGLGDYITRLLTRPLKNLMFGTSDRDTEYYVKDEEDVIDDE